MNIYNKGRTHISVTSFFLFSLIVPIATFAAGPAPVGLFTANNFSILSKTGITNTGSHTSIITGNIGSSPITSAAMSNVFCSEINGTIYGVDSAYVGSGNQTCFAGNPPMANKTMVDNAVLDMATAYTDATGRTIPDGTELYAGNLGGKTIAPGLYKWGTSVSIPTDVTLSGGANDVWIFQIAGDLNVASGGSVPTGVKVILTGGAQASNVFWQVGGVTGATLGTYSTFNGTILSAKQIILQTGSVLNGKALAQTQVTLDANTISIPVPAPAPTPAPTPTPNPTPAPTPTPTPVPVTTGSTLTPNSTFTPTPTPSPTPTSSSIPALTTASSVSNQQTTTTTTTVVATSPKLPNAGIGPDDGNSGMWNVIIPIGAFVVLLSFYLVRKIAK